MIPIKTSVAIALAVLTIGITSGLFLGTVNQKSGSANSTTVTTQTPDPADTVQQFDMSSLFTPSGGPPPPTCSPDLAFPPTIAQIVAQSRTDAENWVKQQFPSDMKASKDSLVDALTSTAFQQGLPANSISSATALQQYLAAFVALYGDKIDKQLIDDVQKTTRSVYAKLDQALQKQQLHFAGNAGSAFSSNGVDMSGSANYSITAGALTGSKLRFNLQGNMKLGSTAIMLSAGYTMCNQPMGGIRTPSSAFHGFGYAMLNVVITGGNNQQVFVMVPVFKPGQADYSFAISKSITF